MAKRLQGPRAAERRRAERKAAEREAAERKITAAEPKSLDPLMEPLRDYLLQKPGCEEGYPFGPDVMVFKVGDKIFGFLAWESVPVVLSLKCDPDRSEDLREEHEGINGAYHLNKKHWHSVALGGSVDMELALELINHSYALIVSTLPKKVRERLRGL